MYKLFFFQLIEIVAIIQGCRVKQRAVCSSARLRQLLTAVAQKQLISTTGGGSQRPLSESPQETKASVGWCARAVCAKSLRGSAGGEGLPYKDYLVPSKRRHTCVHLCPWSVRPDALHDVDCGERERESICITK